MGHCWLHEEGTSVQSFGILGLGPQPGSKGVHHLIIEYELANENISQYLQLSCVPGMIYSSSLPFRVSKCLLKSQ